MSLSLYKEAPSNLGTCESSYVDIRGHHLTSVEARESRDQPDYMNTMRGSPYTDVQTFSPNPQVFNAPERALLSARGHNLGDCCGQGLGHCFRAQVSEVCVIGKVIEILRYGQIRVDYGDL